MEENDESDRPRSADGADGDFPADDLFAPDDNNSNTQSVTDDDAAFERDVDAEFHRLVEEQRQRDAQRAAADCRHRVEAAARARFDQYHMEQSRISSTANGTVQGTAYDVRRGRYRHGGWNPTAYQPAMYQAWQPSPPPPPPPALAVKDPRPWLPHLFQSIIGLSPGYEQDLLRDPHTNRRRRSGGRHPFEYEP